MNDTPIIEDFHGKGHKRIWIDWLRGLECLTPTLVPDHLLARTKSQSTRHIQVSVGASARNVGMKIRTITRGDQVWVLRLPDEAHS